MLRAIIIDDEENSVNTLVSLIQQNTQGIKIVAKTTDPKKGITLIEDYKPDILFLDISMPSMNGFELLDKLSFKNFKLIFTTAHNEYAIKAIKTSALDYLLKPIDIDDLQTCLKKIVQDLPPQTAFQRSTSHIIELAVKDGILFIKPQDVIRIEAAGSYTVFYAEGKIKHVASKNLRETEALLEDPYFCRCHDSHIVNLHKVVKMVSGDGLYALMTDGSMPEISRRKKDFFLDKLKNIYV